MILIKFINISVEDNKTSSNAFLYIFVTLMCKIFNLHLFRNDSVPDTEMFIYMSNF